MLLKAGIELLKVYVVVEGVNSVVKVMYSLLEGVCNVVKVCVVLNCAL